MLRRALAEAFDRRFPYVPTIAEHFREAPDVRRRLEHPEEFWIMIRAEFTWLSQAEIAARHGVPLSTAKHWTARAFRGRP